jgi:hypothetical protein
MELYQKLQCLNQSTKNIDEYHVDEYHKEMEITMILTYTMEDNEATMTRFLNGLNNKIVNIVESHHYIE